MDEFENAGHVLAVDDCPVMRAYVTAGLQSAGLTVRTANSGLEALVMARSESFDAIVLDYTMPGMSGAAVGSALRDHPSTSDCVIAMHSSETEATVRNSGFGDFDSYLDKPCNARSLGDTVARLVAIRRSLK